MFNNFNSMIDTFPKLREQNNATYLSRDSRQVNAGNQTHDSDTVKMH